MLSFYANIPWPMYLILSIGVPIPILIYIIKNRCKYPGSFTIALLMTSYSSVSAGLIKIDVVSNGQLHLPTWLPLPGLAGLPLFLVAAFQSTKDNPEKRRIVIICAVVFIVALLMIAFVVISKLIQR
ncbi:hypothetical protein GE107_03610 [Cohnella sp. CFH 77786]|uniref:hypothetical protein n=1 Tax=Cohnella sp. CFH 77786 TaxID=2662265 RepID=UPI001C60D93E|nr:hypothetical protein [Cohnella sp. CFH 77786]MBW5445150.1 hypothetical protein [Cohnella sp. CFH 77786]